MHPFIKEMHTRLCLSIHKFCIFFDFKDLSIYDREENTPVPRTNKVLLHFPSSALKQDFVHSFHLQLPETAHWKISILAALINPFSRICSNSSSSVSSHREHSTVKEPSQNLQAMPSARYKNQTCQFWGQQLSTPQQNHEHRSIFTCSCVNCRMIAVFFQSRVKCMKTSWKMFQMPLSHLWCLCSELHSEGASKYCLNNNTRCQNTPNKNLTTSWTVSTSSASDLALQRQIPGLC